MSTAMRPFISLRSAAFRLGESLVFQDANWTFGRAEHWAVAGGNGSGKSLFADAIRGRLPLARGELRYHFHAPPGLLAPEEAIAHVAFEERKSGVNGAVVQSRWNSIEQDGAIRVADFLSYGRIMEVNPFEITTRHELARPDFERRRRWAVGLLGIAPFLERALLSLSNGEQQRVQLARALCHPARLLILDEPFSGLDTATRARFGAALRELAARGPRILLLTTRVDELPEWITHVLHVEDCRIGRVGRRMTALWYATKYGAAQRLRPTTVDRAASRKAGEFWKSSEEDSKKALARLRNVTVRYGDTTILSRLNWTIHEGESWALLGPNGSGKTTLLSLILGDNPQAYVNDIEVFGRRLGRGETIWQLKRRIGWVSPELHVHFNDSLSCMEVVASGLRDAIGLFERLTPRQNAAARDCLARFGLQDHWQTPLFGLSVGEQRMALLARALIKRPRLLILDEICQGLDAAHRDLIIRTVDELIEQEGVTTIYVTHREEEIPGAIRMVMRLPWGKVEGRMMKEEGGSLHISKGRRRRERHYIDRSR